MHDRQKIADLLAKPGGRVKWVFAGDSITHGALHSFGYRDYVEHFAERLRFEMHRTGDLVIKTASDGWRTKNLIDDLDASVLQFSPQVVSIHLGMNDAGRDSV